MSRYNHFGLTEIQGEGNLDSSSWFCMDLVVFLTGSDWETFHSSFQNARSGNCPFRDTCERYKRTVSKRGRQLTFDF